MRRNLSNWLICLSKNKSEISGSPWLSGQELQSLNQEVEVSNHSDSDQPVYSSADDGIIY